MTVEAEDLVREIGGLLDRLQVPGAVVIYRSPHVRVERAYGVRTLGRPYQPVTMDDHFRIGSNTKTFTGTAILQLVDEGSLGLDDLLTDRLDLRSPKLAGVRIGHLLQMRSGLGNYSDTLAFNQRLDDPRSCWTPDDLVAAGLEHDTAGTPGGIFHYSNTNTVLLGKLIEKCDRVSLAEALSRRIFGRLGLSGTSMPIGDDRELPAPSAMGYMYGTNVSTLTTDALPVEQQPAARAGELLPGNWTHLTPTWMWAAGAMISTAADLAVYVQALVRGGLLSERLQAVRRASIRNDHPDDPMSAGYGLAIAQFGPMLGHDGTQPGFQSFMGHDPTADATLVVLTNLTASPDGLLPANEVAKRVVGLTAR